jgi:hypothetical protein
MNSVLKLTFWISANLGGQTSTAWQDLITYFTAKGVTTLNDATMAQIVGNQSII